MQGKILMHEYLVKSSKLLHNGSFWQQQQSLYN